MSDPAQLAQLLSSGDPQGTFSCGVTVPLRPPFLLELEASADAEGAAKLLKGKQALDAARAATPCTPDPLADADWEELTDQLDAAPLTLTAKLCIDGAAREAQRCLLDVCLLCRRSPHRAAPAVHCADGCRSLLCRPLPLPLCPLLQCRRRWAWP